MTQDRQISHRTRLNTAAIDGLSHALIAHACSIQTALRRGDENKLQSTLADLAMDFDAIESAIAEPIATPYHTDLGDFTDD